MSGSKCSESDGKKTVFSAAFSFSHQPSLTSLVHHALPVHSSPLALFIAHVAHPPPACARPAIAISRVNGAHRVTWRVRNTVTVTIDVIAGMSSSHGKRVRMRLALLVPKRLDGRDIVTALHVEDRSLVGRVRVGLILILAFLGEGPPVVGAGTLLSLSFVLVQPGSGVSVLEQGSGVLVPLWGKTRGKAMTDDGKEECA